MKFSIARSVPALGLLLMLALLNIALGCAPKTPAPKPAPVIMNTPPTAETPTVARESLANTLDPICDMTLEERVQHTTLYDGKKYGFCSDYCAKEFEKDPKKFMARLAALGKGPQQPAPKMPMAVPAPGG